MTKFFYVLGITVQAILFGEALFFALVTLYSMNAGARVFRYAGL